MNRHSLLIDKDNNVTSKEMQVIIANITTRKKLVFFTVISCGFYHEP